MSKDHHRRPVLEALEPRILYSADLAPIAADLSVAATFVAPTLVTSASAPAIENTQSSPSASTAARPAPIELAVVDTAVAGADALIADIEAQQQAGRPILIVRVEAGEDGIGAVSAALAELQASEQAGSPTTRVSAIHLIGHGDTNGTVLGDTRLDITALRQRALEFANWTPALTADADILLYGCDIAGSGSGQLLAQGLAELTGADVAASNDLTGHVTLGGDWILEYTTGDVSTPSAIRINTQETWYFTLDITTGLELHNTFDADANDSSGNGNNGTLTNGAAIDTAGATNKIDAGKASLDGADDYVDLSAHVANFGAMTTGTIAAWVYSDVTLGGSVVFEASDSVDIDSRLAVIRNGDEFQLFVHEGMTTLLDGTTTTANITPGSWNHVAITVDATGNKIYVNGVQQTVNYLTGNATSNQFFDDVTQLNFMAWGIDRYNTSLFGGPFDGFLDDGRIYSRSLSGTDVTELYNYAGGPLNYTVTNTNDSGVGSLRWAIDQANAHTGTLDTIDFNISGTGVHTINLVAALPTITDGVILDASTDDSFAANSNRPVIILDGNNLGADGLVLSSTADGSTIRGFVVRDFGGAGIHLLPGSDGNSIVGNYLGRLDATGMDAGAGEGNSTSGLAIAAGSVGNVVGGTTAADRNVLSGNGSDGISMMGSNNQILGNYIGVDSTGTAVVGNQGQGIWIGDGANNLIGGGSAGAGNLIGGTLSWAGITVQGAAAVGNTIRGNTIGTDATGTLNLGNAGPGVYLNAGANGTQLGGIVAGEGNLIAFNAFEGLALESSAVSATVLGNLIYANAGLGVDLGRDGVTANDNGDGDTGASNLQNYPVLSSARTNASNQLILAGTLNSTANSYYRIEFFANTSQDSTGYGGGQTYLGFANVTTDGSGNATISITLAVNAPVGTYISATATQATDNTYSTFTDTSEFARNVAAVSDTQASISVDTTSDTSDGDTTSMSTLLANRGADGFISLREAIIAANNSVNGSSVDRITFNLAGGGVQTINIGAIALPEITDAVMIDGWSEPNYAGTPVVELNGDNLGSLLKGLTLGAGSDGSTIRGLIINRFTGTGIEISGSNNQIIQGNWIGVDATGASAAANGVKGLFAVNSTGNLIGGTTAAERNVISGNTEQGIYFDNVDNSTISGNYIGTNVAGTGDVNGIGANLAQSGVVVVNGSSGNTVGGLTAAARNIISGNNWYGFEVMGLASQNNLLLGNYIGTDVSGLLANGNTGGGATFWGAGTGNVFGGGLAGARNVISGNSGIGVLVGNGTTGAVVQGNYIGLAADGASALGNGGVGVTVYFGATNALIGTNADGLNDAAERNVISSNDTGVLVRDVGTTGTVIAGNTIGLAADGTTQRGNINNGVSIWGGATFTTVGGTAAGAGNVLSGNGDNGVGISDAGTSNNLVQGNAIGLNQALTTTVGNINQGVWIGNGATDNIVGGITTAAANIITGATYAGIEISGAASTGNALLGNQVYDNGNMGIDLGGGNSVALNDLGDADPGPNNQQNFPVLAAARTDGSTQLVLNGTFNSNANSFYRIEFFSMAVQDGTGHGEGQTYLGFANLSTDSSGNAAVSATLSVSVAAGSFISATATQSDATYSVFSDTSEFSQNVLVTLAPMATNLGAAETYVEDTPLNLTDIVITDPDSASVTATLTLSNPAAGSLNTATAGAATSTYSTGAGVWSASGSVADVNALLAGLMFTPTTGFNAAFSIATSVSDGDGAPITGTKAVTGTAVNDAPVIPGSALDVNYTENNPVGIDVGITITDADSPSLTGATVRVSAGYVNGEDQLYFTNQAGISGLWNAGSGTLSLSGTASVAAYQTALRSISYDNLSDTPGTAARTVEWVVSDGIDNSVAVYRDIVINTVNDAPTFSSLNGAPTYVEGGAAVLLDVDAQVLDAELGAADNYNGATLTLSRNGGAAAEDQLMFDGTNVSTSGANVLVGGVPIGSFTFTGGQLVVNLGANATQARVNTLMQNLLYANSSATPPGSVVLDWVFSDNNSGAQGSGGALSANGSTTVIVTAVNGTPAITTTGSLLAYTENDIATAVDAGLTVVDTDSANLTGATISISANFISGEDLLAFTDQLGITGNWNAGTGVLTLSGSSTVANYQSALRSITYFNSSDAPGTTNRTVSFVVNDGAANSNTETRDISVAALNDTPTLSVPAAQNAAEDTNLIFSIAGGNPIGLGDIDAGVNPVQLTLSVANGVLSLAGSAGLTFSTGTGSNDTAMSFTGSLVSINAALDGLTYRGNVDFAGADSLAIQIDDLGNTGAGGPLSANAAIAIAVASINDAPQGTATTLTVAENGAHVFSVVDFGFADLNDSPANLLLGVTFSTVPAAGSLTVGGNPINANQFVTLADINGGFVEFTPAANTNGTAYAGLSFRVWDDGGTTNGGVDVDPVARLMTINVGGVNNTPSLTVPAPQSVNEDASLTFGTASGNSISVGDVDAGSNPVQLTLSVANGVLSLASTAGLSITTGTGAGDTTMTFTGTVGSINAALDGLSYIGNLNFNGADTLSLTANDLGNSGAGGPLFATQSLAINVTAVNDAPTDLIRVPALSVSEGALAGTPAGTIAALDPDDVSGFAYNLLNNGGGHFQIDPLTGALSVLGASLPSQATQSSYTIVVQVTDSQGARIDRSFTIGVQSATVAPPPPPTTGVGHAVTAANHGPASNTLGAATSTPEDNGQNVLRRTVNIILDTDSKNRRAPPHVSELKPVTVSVNVHRMLRFAPDERRGDEWATNTLIMSEKAEYKRFELRSLFERLRIESMRTDGTNERWNTNTVAQMLPIDQWQWEDNQVKAYRVELETVAIGGVAMSIGLMLYAVRGAGLVAAMLTSLPAWSTLDPLVVLAKDRTGNKDWEAGSETEVEVDERAVRGVIDEDPYDTSIQDTLILDTSIRFTSIQAPSTPNRRSH